MTQRTKTVLTTFLIVYGAVLLICLWVLGAVDGAGLWTGLTKLAFVATPTLLIGELFRRVMWKWKLVQKVVRIPDLNGEWSGTLDSMHADAAGNRQPPIPIALKIVQSFTSVYVFFKTDHMSSFSDSICAHLAFHSELDRCRLIYTYCNEPAATSRLDRHCGTAMLDVVELRPSELRGNYFTDRKPQTKGVIQVKKR